MKISKEITTGFITILAIGLLVAGVNFLKGNSFFGGDQVYYAYFPNSGGVTPATSVYVNGVIVGKILDIELTGDQDSLKKVKMTFNITDSDFKISKGSVLEAGAVDLFTKGLIIRLNPDLTAGYYKPETEIQGVVTVDLTSEVKAYADPISQKLQVMMSSIDRLATGVSAFWDTSATSELESTFKEIKMAVHKFGDAANEIEGLLSDEKVKLSRIMSNVETITVNLKKSNENVKGIVGNVKEFTDQLVTSEFTGVIANAKVTLERVNETLDNANNGGGTLGKLLHDEALYNELVNTNKELQELVDDIQVHPERYIHFSVLGAKSKSPFTNTQEKKLKDFADSIP